MSALISALDNFTPVQLGENGHCEYTWSNNVREKIVQLSFQLTRVKNEDIIKRLAETTDKIIEELKCLYSSSVMSREEFLEYMSMLYRMIGHTRDIVDGKGEYTLSYMLLEVWEKHYPELAKFALRLFVLPPAELLGTNEASNYHPYGSWKDIKYIFLRNPLTELSKYGCELLLNQLRLDVVSENPSLVAKWIPREKTRFHSMFELLATQYYANYITTARTNESKAKAVLKAKMDFRKLISSLNKKLDTVQIKQCGLKWSEIKPEKQTSITMHKQKRAFLNIKKDGKQRYELADRIVCANNFKEYVEKAVKGEVEIKGKRVGLNDFTAEALKLINSGRMDSTEAELLNCQWENNATQTGALGKMIAMVDVSFSMNGDPLNAAVALGIRVAEKSMLGKRVLTFSATPTWVNLDNETKFINMVEVVRKAEWGMNTNFFLALKMILDAVISQKLTPEDVEDMVLAIFSDMQIDEADRNSLSMMESIEAMYAEAGNRLWGKPFKTPHILFWNLRSTTGFPTLSTRNNASMMSGFSPALLNVFCEQGIDSLQSCTPWSLLQKCLDNERYKPLDEFLRDSL